MRRLPRLTAPLLVAVLVWLVSPAGAATGETARAESATGAGYWHTSGTTIVDAAGNPVRIAGVTWYGMDTATWVPAGLEFQRYTTIMDEVKLLRYNTIRLPFANELVERNPIVTRAVRANPQFRGERALDVLDAIVGYARQIGLKIILDDHRSHAARPLEINTLDETLWYTRQYPEAAWIRDWQTLARRYLDNDAVVGFDLRNEPHTYGSAPWTVDAYLHRGATWGPYRGVSNPATDWRLAAARAGNAVLAINPHLLIIVQGIHLYTDGTGSVTSSWWAGVLTPIKRYPVQLDVPHQLVYSIHEWGPRKFAMPWFKTMTYASLQQTWHRLWSFLLDDPHAVYAAPLWIGEFGTCNNSPLCVDAVQGPNQATWFQSLVRFLAAHPEVSWSFFALNGTNANRCRTDNGLLNAKWNRVSSRALQERLRSIQSVPGVEPAPEGTLLPGTGTTEKPRPANTTLCRLP